jgi:hypothetical protein
VKIPTDEYGRLIDTMPMPAKSNLYDGNRCGACGVRGHDRRNCPAAPRPAAKWVRR